MSPGDAIEIAILVVLLILSAFFSCSETAITGLNRMRIRSLTDDGDKTAARVWELLENQSKVLSAILICNNVVNLSASSITTSLAIRICTNIGLGENTGLGVGISTGVLTFLILIFGEITPKQLATKKSETIALRYSRIIKFVTWFLTPIIFIVNQISRLILKLFGVDWSGKNEKITEDELRTIVDVSHEEGVIETEEHQMITNIVDFGDSLVKDVMIPRMDIVMVESRISYADLLHEFTEHKYARLPIYDDTIDNIIGIINLKDFVFEADSENFDVRSLIREAHFTYEYKNVSELFLEMQKDSVPMTIVLDEYGALSGLITIEDLLEEIVGELRDEYDTDEEDEIQKISEDSYHVLGSTSLDDINDILGLGIESEDYDSIAGHVIGLLEHFPEEGETAEDDGAIYNVIQVDGNRIDKLQIDIKPELEASEADGSSDTDTSSAAGE
ncbi:MAG: HlyC/CorC family transporter [Eubacterium sp.]|nr:HlyC/CorC family transporter [Eubacterium sp.]